MNQHVESGCINYGSAIFGLGSVVFFIGLFLPLCLAGEIRLKRVCHASTTLVKLGDVAEVVDSDPAVTKKLEALELVPAPVPGARRYLRLRQIQDLISDRGINLADHHFSGAHQVAIDAGRKSSTLGGSTRRSTAARQVHELVRKAIKRHLLSIVPERKAWQVEVQLTQSQVDHLESTQGNVRAEGGIPPWVGDQSLVLRGITLDGEDVTVPVRARVSLPVSTVVAVRSLPRGAVIRASDVELKPDKRANGQRQKADIFLAVEDVLGMEAARAISAGQVLRRSAVRRPVLVRRNEAVTVYSRASGIRARATARARQDGGLGELIMVESMTDRKKILRPGYQRGRGRRVRGRYAGRLKVRMDGGLEW